MKTAFIFGAGEFGRKLSESIKDNYKVIGFLDNGDCYKKINDIEVFIPGEILNYEFTEIIIGSNSFSAIDNMINQLIDMGIDKGKINCSYAMKEVDVTISEIFHLQHNLFEEKTKHSFYRYNLIIQILAIENIYGFNDIGIEISKKYRKIVMPDDDIEKYIEGVKLLVNSFKKEGFKKDSFISLNKKGDLIDGTHRMALLICNNIKSSRVRILNTYWHLEGERDLNWLKSYNHIFSENEIKVIENKYEEIAERLIYG